MSQNLFFKTLSFKNFLSFGNVETELDLSFEGTTLINGHNIDAGSANGCGKTTIINALCFAIYNKPFDNINLPRLINSTNASRDTLMEVKLSFEKGKDQYEVYRCRGERQDVALTMNGEDITPSSITELDRLVERIIGFSYELFTKIIIFSGSSLPFLMMPISHQRQQIEELFNITLLSEKADALRQSIKQTEMDQAIQQAIIKEQETANNLHQKHINEAKIRVDNWDKARDSHMLRIVEALEAVKGVDFEAEQQFHDAKTQLTGQITELSMKYQSSNKDAKTIKQKIEKLCEEITHLEDHKCPYCLQAMADAPLRLEKLKQELDDKKLSLEDLEQFNTNVEEELKQLEELLTEVSSNIKHKNMHELLITHNNAETLKSKLDDLAASTNPHIDAYEQLLAEAKKDIDMTKIDELVARLDHQQFLLKLLTDKNSFVRRTIINKMIPFLNRQLNEYTRALGLPHSVKFDADMSCTVAEFGRELDFGNLSGGEKKRVNLAMSLAFRDVLHHLHAKVNILVADEIDGGSIDPTGIDLITKMLKNKSRDEGVSIWLISHRPEVAGRLDRDITVRKENGFSSITYL